MTQNERILALLADGNWHSHHELYGLHCVAHSRVSELRKRGYHIEARRNGDLYEYRWLNVYWRGSEEATRAHAPLQLSIGEAA